MPKSARPVFLSYDGSNVRLFDAGNGRLIRSFTNSEAKKALLAVAEHPDARLCRRVEGCGLATGEWVPEHWEPIPDA